MTRVSKFSLSVLAVMLVILVSRTFTAEPHTAYAESAIPAGASVLGYTKRVINLNPTTADISPDGAGVYPLYNGQWYKKTPPSLDHYSMEDGVLALSLDGDLTTISRDMTQHQLPLLSGSEGFYVQFEVRLSDNNPDHWPAVWLMPAEHNRRQDDHYRGDPVNFERWQEIDVDEGGLGPGMTGTAHNWSGIWPHYTKIHNTNNRSSTPLDRTSWHKFAAGYDPIRHKITWWLDGKKQFSAKSADISDYAADQHFYLLVTAQTHGQNVPYTMYIRNITAYVPANSDLPAK